jgi:hypothetical protein
MSDQLTIEKFLSGIAEDFLTTRSDIITFAVVIAAIIIVFVLLFFLLRFFEQKKVRTVFHEKFEELIRKFDLTINELDLLGEMSRFLRNRNKKYLLLTNKATFLYALQELKAEKKIPAEYAASLAAKIGVAENLRIDHLNSTKKLEQNTPVKLEPAKGQRFIGVIAKKQNGSFTVRIKNEGAPVPAKNKLLLYVCNFRGIHFYKVPIIDTGGNLITFAHSDTMELMKNNAQLNVYIRKEGLKAEKQEKGKVISFWKGGALITNPAKQLRKDDDIRIAFLPSDSNPYFTNAEVVKIGSGKSVAEVRFKHLL